jgi:hypothetical protein
MNEGWSLERMLEAWGLRACGGSLKNPLNLSTGGATGTDENWQAKQYVEGVTGFSLARPVLVWVFAQGLDVAAFRLRQPGESLTQALKRLGWQDYVMLPAARIALEVLRDFEVELGEALEERPFTPMFEPEEEDAESIARSAGVRRG